MEFVVVCLVSLIASGMTLFSGFGLGSILMPVVAIFFPLEVAIASTAIVHLANNFFKLSLFGKYRQNDVLARFAIPAIVFAALGAWALTTMTDLKPVFSYSLLGKPFNIELVKLVIAVLIAAFSLFEILPRLKNLRFSPRLLPIGGMVSGFLGGLSGHQGAMRSAFLANAGLTKEQFIGTGVAIACIVDVTRITVYGVHLSLIGVENAPLIGAASLAAFLGAFIGKRLVENVTMALIQKFVAFGLIFLSLALGCGII